MQRVAILGLGVMGGGMAANWLAKGFEVSVWNRTRSKAEPLAAKGTKASPKLFYLVKGKVSQAATHTRKKAARVAKATASISGMDSIHLIAKVKALAKEAGGIDYLKALVNVLAD